MRFMVEPFLADKLTGVLRRYRLVNLFLQACATAGARLPIGEDFDTTRGTDQSGAFQTVGTGRTGGGGSVSPLITVGADFADGLNGS